MKREEAIVLGAAGAVARSGRPSRDAWWLLAIPLMFALPGVVHAQDADTVPPTSATVDGRVMRPRVRALGPVGGAWVTIHRVASDSAGPIDSMRTAGDGRFHFRYMRHGRSDAVYFVSASYDGIAYFSRPLTTTRVTGDDAAIAVFDTTSIHFPLAIKGRHVIVSSPSVNGTREIVEAYEIANESDQTLVSPDDAHPTWTAPIPAGVVTLQVGESDVSAAAITASGGRVRVTAPFAPGLKQLSFSYVVPQSLFPLHIPIEEPTTVLELLLEEPRAEARGANIKPQQPATIERRIFQRYLGADAPAGSSIEVRVPVITAAANVHIYWEIAAALAALMAAGLAAWYARARSRRTGGVSKPAIREPSATETLARAIATLDSEFEHTATNDVAARAAYEDRRRQLKRELATSLDSGARSI
ncbi:MAG: hypothetical protein ABI884_10025 [Gemmatimonadota bacterium]